MHVLLSVGTAPGLHTGYGGQALLLLQAILAADPAHTVTVLCWNFQVRGPRALHPIPTAEFMRMAPTMKRVLDAQPASEQAEWARRVSWMGNWYTVFPAPIEKQHLNAAIMNTGADLFLCLQDIFMFQPGTFACPALTWMPVHFLPLEKSTKRALSDFDVLVAISGYGAELLRTSFGAQHGPTALKHIEIIPHGRPATTFRPGPHQLDSGDEGIARHRSHRAALRQRLGWPVLSASAGSASTPRTWADGPGGDGAVHITLMVASNSEESGRKAYDAQLQAWVAFAERREAEGYPRDATFLVLHAEASKAYDLGALLETFGEFPERTLYEDLADRKGRTVADPLIGIRGARFLIVPPSKLGTTSDADMAAMFQAADVLLAATASEGCGVPILEAQLCGCPVVTNATTAMPEQTLLGISAPVGQYIARMDFNAGWLLPSVPHVAAALYELSKWTEQERAERARAALPTIVARYEDAPVTAAWEDLLRRLQRDVVAPWRAQVACAVSLPMGLPLPPTTLWGQASGVELTKAEPREELGGLGGLGEPWRTDLGKWLHSPPLRIALAPERALALVAARALAQHEATVASTTSKLQELAHLRGRLLTRLQYVQGAIRELEACRSL